MQSTKASDDDGLIVLAGQLSHVSDTCATEDLYLPLSQALHAAVTTGRKTLMNARISRAVCMVVWYYLVGDQVAIHNFGEKGTGERPPS